MYVREPARNSLELGTQRPAKLNMNQMVCGTAP
jgi:hypothetical protein